MRPGLWYSGLYVGVSTCAIPLIKPLCRRCGLPLTKRSFGPLSAHNCRVLRVGGCSYQVLHTLDNTGSRPHNDTLGSGQELEAPFLGSFLSWRWKTIAVVAAELRRVRAAMQDHFAPDFFGKLEDATLLSDVTRLCADKAPSGSGSGCRIATAEDQGRGATNETGKLDFAPSRWGGPCCIIALLVHSP